MGCKYSEWRTGKCELWDENAFEHIMTSCDENGICRIEDDDDPGKYCEDYDGD